MNIVLRWEAINDPLIGSTNTPLIKLICEGDKRSRTCIAVAMSNRYNWRKIRISWFRRCVMRRGFCRRESCEYQCGGILACHQSVVCQKSKLVVGAMIGCTNGKDRRAAGETVVVPLVAGVMPAFKPRVDSRDGDCSAPLATPA